MTTTTATTSQVTPLSGEYKFDTAHSRLGFVARHAMVTKVRGQFEAFDGTLHLDAEDPSRSSVTVTADVASVTTGNEDRDKHLRANDFFDAANFPKITFASTGIEPAGGDRYRVTGDLTIRGVTRTTTFEVQFTGAARDPFGNERVGFESRAVVNRKDFGVNWNAALEAGGVLVSDKVDLELDISAVRSA